MSGKTQVSDCTSSTMPRIRSYHNLKFSKHTLFLLQCSFSIYNYYRYVVNFIFLFQDKCHFHLLQCQGLHLHHRCQGQQPHPLHRLHHHHIHNSGIQVCICQWLLAIILLLSTPEGTIHL